MPNPLSKQRSIARIQANAAVIRDKCLVEKWINIFWRHPTFSCSYISEYMHIKFLFHQSPINLNFRLKLVQQQLYVCFVSFITSNDHLFANVIAFCTKISGMFHSDTNMPFLDIEQTVEKYCKRAPQCESTEKLLVESDEGNKKFFMLPHQI